MKKKKLLIIILIIPLITVFAISYYLTFNKYNSNVEIKKNELVNPGKKLQAVSLNKDKVVLSENTEIIKIDRYLNSGEDKVAEETKAGTELAGKTRKDIETIYGEGGYFISEFSPEKVVLVRKVNYQLEGDYPVFMPNKYVIWVKDGNLAIYKTDNNGIAYDAIYVTNKNISRLKKDELQLIKNGSKEYQFDTCEAAEEALGELST